jgi:hypothetical protein
MVSMTVFRLLSVAWNRSLPMTVTTYTAATRYAGWTTIRRASTRDNASTERMRG